MKGMQRRFHEITIDEDTDTTGDEWLSKPLQMITAYDKARCNWAGFRHELTRWGDARRGWICNDGKVVEDTR